MSATTFDSIGYMRRLEESGVPRQQAETQADALRQVLERYDEANRREVATKADLQNVKQELQVAVKELELRLLKWQRGFSLAFAAILAKGFGWLGF